MRCLVIREDERFTAVLLEHSVVASGGSARQAMDRLAYCMKQLTRLGCDITQIVDSGPAIQKAWRHPSVVRLDVTQDLEQQGVQYAAFTNGDLV